MKKIVVWLMAFIVLTMGLVSVDESAIAIAEGRNYGTYVDGDFTYSYTSDKDGECELYMFSTNLTDYYELNIPKSLDGNTILVICGGTFIGCDKMTSIKIPDGVTNLSSQVCWNCKNLESVTISASVKYLEGNYDYSLHSSSTIFYKCPNIKYLIMDKNNKTYDSRDNCNGIIKTDSNELVLGCKNTVIPNTVTAIGKAAFVYCQMESIEIPDSVIYIKGGAFASTYLKKIIIPNSVTYIAKDAFWGCEFLESATIPASVTFIGENAFGSDNKLTLYVEKDSYAEQYAIDNDIPYEIYGWVQDGSSWYYKQEGKTLTGWQKISNKWYYFNNSGVMQTGWVKLNNKWYYFGSNGVMVTGWQKLSKKWYYFNTSGVMQTGWVKLSNKWYYLGTDGVMATNWKKLSGSYYYFGSDGKMATGWQKILGKWYYFGTNGKMVSNTTMTIDGKKYTFNASGIVITS